MLASRHPKGAAALGLRACVSRCLFWWPSICAVLHTADRDRYPLHTAAHRRHRYRLVAMIAANVDDEALVVPGGIKRNARIAYKSAVNYNGRYDQCKVGPRLPPPNPLSLWGYYCTRAILS